MTQAVRLTTRAERETLRSIRRACYAGLDSLTLRQEVGMRAAAIVPSEAYALMATDPETGLFTHGWGERLSDSFVQSYVTRVYPDEVVEFIDFARSGGVVSTENSDPFLEVLRADGLEHALHAVLAVEGGIYGSWCMFREAGSRTFAEPETRFMQAIAPHVARGLQAAAATEAALRDAATADVAAPGVLVLDARSRIVLRSGPAAEQLADLADVGMRTEAHPYALVSLLTRLAAAHARPEGPLGAELRAQGRSGRWYVLRASLAEPDASGESARVVVIEPAAPRDASPFLSQAYGLTPREREVLLLVVRGESTKRIAARLGLSVYTVQDHLEHACEKVGVRGRKALVAKIFLDGYATPPEG
ncbi:MAG TPA: helix-turn-helix transcriptional regulator [Longimicrobiaceae bacterium]|nr:helix-turn-helix transcriptional regulator [Longimicrobiaceae bacterium]